MPLKALSWVFQQSAPLLLRPKLDRAQWRWLAAFVLNCTPARFERNKAQMQRMAHYSLECLQALREETGIRYDNAARGILQVFATQDEWEGGQRAARVLDQLGIEHALVGLDAAQRLEPALRNRTTPLVGGLHLPRDETGDCHLFCTELTALLQARGCTFKFNTRVTRLRVSGHGLDHIETSHGAEHADAYVLACGPYAPTLLADVGIRLPVYPVKGYSLTWPIETAVRAPQSSVMDEHSKVMITRLGTRMRAAGMAEVTGFDPRLRDRPLNDIRARVAQLFPGAADFSGGAAWCGFRPMTPDGPARVGATKIPGLYINAGHGSNGWTQACGTAACLAALISGDRPAISLKPPNEERHGRI